MYGSHPPCPKLSAKGKIAKGELGNEVFGIRKK